MRACVNRVSELSLSLSSLSLSLPPSLPRSLPLSLSLSLPLSLPSSLRHTDIHTPHRNRMSELLLFRENMRFRLAKWTNSDVWAGPKNQVGASHAHARARSNTHTHQHTHTCPQLRHTTTFVFLPDLPHTSPRSLAPTHTGTNSSSDLCVCACVQVSRVTLCVCVRV